MLLTELFNNAGKNWEWVETETNYAVANFTVGKITYEFYIDTEAGSSVDWVAEFKVPWGRSYDEKYGVTGTGNSAIVLSYVIDILRSFLQKYKGKVRTLSFDAKEASRMKLYSNMIRRLVPAWELSTSTSKQLGTTFTLINPDFAPVTVNETVEEDHELIRIAKAVYPYIVPYIGSGSNELVNLGTISEMTGTTNEFLGSISVELLGGDEYKLRSVDHASGETPDKVRESIGFWDEDNNAIVFNIAHIGKTRITTAITHELRHALDDRKSGGFPASPKNKDPDKFNKYFTPKKNKHRNPATEYIAQPAEINARFTEILHKLDNLIPKRQAVIPAAELHNRLMHDLNQLMITFEIANLFPEKQKSKEYKQLYKRAAKFIDSVLHKH